MQGWPFGTHQSHFIFHTCLNVVPGDVTWCRIIIHIKAGRVWKGPAFFLVGGSTSLFPLCRYYIWNGHIFPFCLLNNICTKKARQVVRVDWSWMYFLSLSLSFFSIQQSPEASITDYRVPPFEWSFVYCQNKGASGLRRGARQGNGLGSAIRMSGTAGSG